jgi:hypothetical protein
VTIRVPKEGAQPESTRCQTFKGYSWRHLSVSKVMRGRLGWRLRWSERGEILEEIKHRVMAPLFLLRDHGSFQQYSVENLIHSRAEEMDWIVGLATQDEKSAL